MFNDESDPQNSATHNVLVLAHMEARILHAALEDMLRPTSSLVDSRPEIEFRTLDYDSPGIEDAAKRLAKNRE